MATVKEEARQLVDGLAEDATWDDLKLEIELRRKIERGLADMEAGRTIPAEEVERKYGFSGGDWSTRKGPTMTSTKFMRRSRSELLRLRSALSRLSSLARDR